MIDRLVRHFRPLEKLLRRRGRTREEAEDLIQESFLRGKRYLDEGGEIREPEAFLVRTALNLSRDELQREHRHLYSRKPVEELLVPDAGPGPVEVVEAQQQLERLQRSLNKAGPRAREVFLMHRLHGMTYTQIAAHFEVSPSAIEKHIAKALAVLGEEMMEP